MNKIRMSGKKQRLMCFFQLWIPTAYLFSYFLLLVYKIWNKINYLFMYLGKPIISFGCKWIVVEISRSLLYFLLAMYK